MDWAKLRGIGISLGLWKIQRKFWEIYIPVVFVLVLIATKTSYLFSMDFSNTWDGSGHWVLLSLFSQLAQKYQAEGYVLDWFGGFFAFRYYTTFFYFLGNMFLKTGMDTSQALDVTVGVTIGIYWLGYYFFVRSFLPVHLSLAALLFYLSFPGSSQLSTSLNGIPEGNYASILGSGLVYTCLGIFFRWERQHAKGKNEALLCLGVIATCSLVGYTHYLSFIFLHLILITYHFWNWKRIALEPGTKIFSRLSFIFLPILVSLPSLWGPLTEISESLGEAMTMSHPFLKSLVGTLEKEGILNISVKSPYRLIPLFALAGLLMSIRRKRNHFFFVLVLLFYSLVQDISWLYFFPGTKIHFYRMWDLMLGFLFYLGVRGLWEYRPGFRMRISLLFLAGLGFFFHQPFLGASHFPHDVENAFQIFLRKEFAEGPSHILMETTTGSLWKRNPHRELIALREIGAITENGLLVESSWNPYVQRLYLPMRHSQDFQWGFMDPISVFKMPRPPEYLSLRYLKEKQIGFLVSKTESFRKNFEFLEEMPEVQKTSIGYLDIWDARKIITQSDDFPVIGLLSLETKLDGKRDPSPEQFFLESYMILSGGFFSGSEHYSEARSFPYFKADRVQLVDLNPYWRAYSKSPTMPQSWNLTGDIRGMVDAIWIYDPETHRIIANYPMETLPSVGSELKCKRTISNQSFHPGLRTSDGVSILRNQFNQIYSCHSKEGMHFETSTANGRIKYWMLNLLFYFSLALAGAFLYRKIKKGSSL